jgi:hypothetical protein
MDAASVSYACLIMLHSETTLKLLRWRLGVR